jgi:uncharacterized membrane protein
MWVEIMLFKIEWSRHFTLFIDILFVKHFLTIKIVDNITGFWINKVTSLISWSTLLV